MGVCATCSPGLSPSLLVSAACGHGCARAGVVRAPFPAAWLRIVSRDSIFLLQTWGTLLPPSGMACSLLTLLPLGSCPVQWEPTAPGSPQLLSHGRPASSPTGFFLVISQPCRGAPWWQSPCPAPLLRPGQVGLWGPGWRQGCVLTAGLPCPCWAPVPAPLSGNHHSLPSLCALLLHVQSDGRTFGSTKPSLIFAGAPWNVRRQHWACSALVS